MIVKLPDESEVVNFKLDDSDIQMTVKDVQDLYWEYNPMFKFFNLMDAEIFIFTYSDYTEMPEITMDALSIYKQEKRKMLAEKVK